MGSIWGFHLKELRSRYRCYQRSAAATHGDDDVDDHATAHDYDYLSSDNEAISFSLSLFLLFSLFGALQLICFAKIRYLSLYLNLNHSVIAVVLT